MGERYPVGGTGPTGEYIDDDDQAASACETCKETPDFGSSMDERERK